MEDGIKLPSAVDSGATPRDPNQFKKGLQREFRIPKKPRNFDKNLKRLKETGTLSREDFDSGADLGAFIDWYNSSVIKKRENQAQNDIIEISKFLAKINTQKNIMLKPTKNDRI